MELSSKITDSEWEVMRVVWTLNEATSNDIIDVLEKKKDWKPATTKTFIGRLVKKGILETKKQGKRYIYSAKISEGESIRNNLDDFLDNICNRDRGKTIANMISKSTLSHDDIALLKRVIENKEKDAVDEIPCNCVPGQCKCKHDCSNHHQKMC
ncbi:MULTISPECIES: CopY/TcrY family copper transport repressor [Bacillaceae]|uniref:CopY/TcrY family copper transport repressor n=1 Tax=Bacillaceae TaxID=186817 RepID=UPI001C1080AE|nr:MULTISPECIES: CopY/TcrY family copper transport repressor [Bacillaceae]MBU5344119.1 CopY/TcrY family copper transport repressor [Caldifermentibacillus hisashii]MCB7070288.1 CopY/TcrY family copper transport repressor [Caldibacillus sp. 210928-DFI.2.22]MCB7073752.1 CopY/TcrY family copper transport repressor [Caldibacillus sp. 210928-DFI.2.18]